MQSKLLALGPRFGRFLGPQGRLLRLPGVAIWTILSNNLFMKFFFQLTLRVDHRRDYTLIILFPFEMNEMLYRYINSPVGVGCASSLTGK